MTTAVVIEPGDQVHGVVVVEARMFIAMIEALAAHRDVDLRVVLGLPVPAGRILTDPVYEPVITEHVAGPPATR